MIIDIIVSAIVFISAFISFLRGFIREVLTILGTAGGLIASYFGGPVLSPMVQKWLGVVEGEDPDKLLGLIPYALIGDALAFGGIFVIVVILLSILSHFLAESAKSLGLGAVDRSLGVLFGLIRGVLLIGLLYMPIYLFVEKDERQVWFTGAHSFFYMEAVSGSMAMLLPEGASENVKVKTEDTGEKVDALKGLQDKLKDIDLLQKDAGDEKAVSTEDVKNGYTPEFREKMDELFEDAGSPGSNLNE